MDSSINERISNAEGAFNVYSQSGELWYIVTATNATADDYAIMLAVEPEAKPVIVTNQNIGAVRKQSTDKKK